MKLPLDPAQLKVHRRLLVTVGGAVARSYSRVVRRAHDRLGQVGTGLSDGLALIDDSSGFAAVRRDC